LTARLPVLPLADVDAVTTFILRELHLEGH